MDATGSQQPGECALNDLTIIEKLKRRDSAATQDFVRTHAGWMLSVSRRILRNDALAEDSVQLAFSKIFNNLDHFQGEARLRTWMHRIVVNQALMALRKQKSLKESSLDELMPIFDGNGCRIEESWVEMKTPEVLLESTQTTELVLSMIDELPPNYRVILLLRDIEELPISQVADMLDISASNVKVRHHRARAALKKLMEPLLRGSTP